MDLIQLDRENMDLKKALKLQESTIDSINKEKQFLQENLKKQMMNNKTQNEEIIRLND